MRLPAGFIDELRTRTSLSDVVGRRVLWDRRKSMPSKGDFWAACPFHQEKTPSFHVDDRKGFYYCFGCQAKGDAIGFVRETEGVDFIEAVRILATDAGMAMPDGQKSARSADFRPDPAVSARRQARDAEAARKARWMWDRARAIWHQAERGHPLLLQYLEARGTLVEALERTWGGAPPCLRLHPALDHYEGEDRHGRPVLRHTGPAMVALIARPGFVAGIHRTWITPQGRARLGGVTLAKQMMGRTGAMFGVPIRFTAPAERMIVGEGIETVLAAWSRRQVDHLAGHGPLWSAEAAVSLGALAGGGDGRFGGPVSRHTGRPLSSGVPDMARPGWLAPDMVDHLVILAEGSAKDPNQAERRARCAKRRHQWRADGTARRCELKLPPGGWDSGLDFADLAVGRVA